MADFKVIFSGLMCHVEINSSVRAAAIIRDSLHAPRIWVREGDVLPPDPTFDEEPRYRGWRIFKIPSEARIQLNGLEQGKAPQPPYPAVARMSELIPRFIPADEILSIQQHPWVRAYIVYSGGTFSVNCYYPESARFKGSDTYYCRARELQLTTKTVINATEVKIVDAISGRQITVQVNSTVAFSHLDKDPDSPDHQLYVHVSKGNAAVLAIEKKDWDCPQDDCTLPLQLPPLVSVSVECMSTQWP